MSNKTITQMPNSPCKGRTSGVEPTAMYNVPPWFNTEALILGFKGFSQLVEITRDPTRPSGRYDNIEDALKALHKRFQFIAHAKEGTATVILHTYLPFVRADFHVVLQTSERALMLGDSDEVGWFEKSPAGPLRQWATEEDMLKGVFPGHDGAQSVYSVPVASPNPIDIHNISAEEDFEKTFQYMMLHHGRAPPDVLVRKVWASYCGRHALSTDDVKQNPYMAKWYQYAKWQLPEQPALGSIRDPDTTYGGDFSPPRNFHASVPRPYAVMTDPPKFDKGHFVTTKFSNGL